MLCILRGRFGGTSSGWLGTRSLGVSCVFMERKEWSLFWRVGVSGEVEIFIVKFSKSTLFICSSFYFLFFIKSFVFQFVAMPYWNECNRYSKLIKFFFFRICFWLDPWCGEVILKGAFLAPFWIALNKDTYLACYMRWTNEVIHWDVLFIRSVHDWEMEILQYFLGLLYSHKIGGARND